MKNVRIAIVLVGILLPYLVRLPGGMEWLRQYTDVGVEGLLFFGAFNAIAWGSLLLLTLVYRKPISMLIPALSGFGFLAWSHATYDLSSDAQAAIGLIFIPIFALIPIALGAGLSFVIERLLLTPKAK